MSAAGECVDAYAGGASECVGARASGAGQGAGASADGADRGASENAGALAGGAADLRATARFVGAFLDELCRWGVHDVVVSPGSRSTPLAMCAYELSRRAPERLRLFVDVDERGAAFFALGLAKAGGRPAALICTSGTAVANYYPAVLEAESSRVPLIVLTGDRPPRLQGLGAPQTCDQLKAYGDHVRAFRQMPLPSADAASLAFARQAAREAVIAAGGDVGVGEAAAAAVCADGCGVTARIAGCCAGGPVYLNFPFDEPLKPDLSTAGLFDGGRKCVACSDVAVGVEAAACAGVTVRPEAAVHADAAASAEATDDAAAARIGVADVSRETSVPSLGIVPSGVVSVRVTMTSEAARAVSDLLAGARALMLAGEGTCSTVEEARAVLAWARAFGVPLLADPLSGLRSFDEPFVIDNYDSVLGAGGAAPEGLRPQVIVRFGRYPVSKRATQFVAATRPVQIVVDERETRDFNAATDVFVPCRPIEFARAMMGARTEGEAEASLSPFLLPAGVSCRMDGGERASARPHRGGSVQRCRRRRCGGDGHGRPRSDGNVRGRVRAARRGAGAGGVVPVRGQFHEHPRARHLPFEKRQAPCRAVQPRPERHRRHGVDGARRRAAFRADDADHRRPHAAARPERARAPARAARAARSSRRARRERMRAQHRHRASEQQRRRHLRYAAAAL